MHWLGQDMNMDTGWAAVWTAVLQSITVLQHLSRKGQKDAK